MGRAASTGLAVDRILSAVRPGTGAAADLPVAGLPLASARDYFAVAATARFRASQRRRGRDAARHGMVLVIGAAVLDCLWLGPLHPDAATLVVALNLAVGLIAAVSYATITTWARRRPEVGVFVTLAAVDAATIAIGVARPDLGLVAAGYLLLLPTVVALVLLWATTIHLGWLALHGVAVLGYVLFAPPASLGGGTRIDMLALLGVASTVSQFGHMSALRARVLSYVQIERIRALNRQARRDEARLDRLNTVLEQTAMTDALTGLRNRSSLKLDLQVVRARIARHHEQYGLLVLDLDRFKAINDTLGHVAGDGVLRAIAESFRSTMRVGDGAYRYGGEEFVILMRVTDAQEAAVAGERMRCAVEDLAIPHQRNPPHDHVTISVGVATFSLDDLAADDDEWFARADRALYRAKAGGRNRCARETLEHLAR